MTKAAVVLFSFISLSVLVSCNGSVPEDGPEGQEDGDVPVLAVFYDTADRELLHNVADLAVSNFKSAVEKAGLSFDVNLQWFNADSVDLDVTMEKIGFDETVFGIVGPQSSAASRSILSVGRTLADKFDICKPIILPAATSVELQRQYSDLSYVWFLSESNISQGEMFMVVADSLKYKNINIVVTDDPYGRDFADYLPYVGKEWGIPVSNIRFVPSDAPESFFADAVRIVNERNPSGMTIVASSTPSFYEAAAALGFGNVFFTDAAYSGNNSGSFGNVSGLSLSPSPGSGFLDYFRKCFGVDPTNGEAQFYDAVILSLLAQFGAEQSEVSPNSKILNFCEGQSFGFSWTGDGLYDIIIDLLRDGVRGLNLASVSLDVDHPNISSTYLIWSAKSGKVTFERFLETRKYSRRSQQGGSACDWSPTEMDVDIDADLSDGKEYKEGGANWALVVAASEGWNNYRHQSDALAIYHILRESGYDDDHIVLIINNDLAWDSHNIFPGNIFNDISLGNNLYDDISIDYLTKDISPDKLEGVFSPAPEDNIFVFWSGHGTVEGSLCWLESSTPKYCTISPTQVDSWVQKMEDKGFNKMLIVLEACYSGKIAKTVNHPGVLVITAADEYESSFAVDNYYSELGTYLADDFSLLFYHTVEQNHRISLHDLYSDLYLGVKLSHVTISDFSLYGSLTKNTMVDYLPE